MTAPPTLTDRQSLDRQRQRALRQGFADVLHHAVADDLQERLAAVNKTFTDAVTVTGFPDLWRDLRPQDRVVSDTDTLDLALGSADLVIHALALHWANDPVGQLIQSRRALRPDGLFLGCLLGGTTLVELRDALSQAEIDVLGGLSPRIAPMAEVRDMGGLLQRAGFALPVADTLPMTLSYRDLWHLMADLRAMGEGNALANRHRRPAPRRLFSRAAELYAERHSTEDGRVTATFEVIFLTGWAPDDSQPKPLRPGSAKARLADVLGTDEQPLPGPSDPELD